MKQKYNLALTPKTNLAAVECAQQISSLAETYLLSEKSFPHVTLYQFEADQNEIVNIWRCVSEIWNENPLYLEFKNFSFVTFDDVIYWISLLPNNNDKLHQMHEMIANVLQLSIKKTFSPHMTLLNTKNKNCENEMKQLSQSYIPIADRFVLSLGKSDAVGQLTEIIFHL